MKKCFLYLLLLLVAFACKKDTIVLPEQAPEPAPPQTTSLRVSYKALMNGQDLVFNRAKLYANFFGDSLNVNLFKYYISNIVLKKDDGSTYAVPESYYLVNHGSSGGNIFEMKNIPEGNYVKVEFLLGVDSARNTAGAQDGALSPENEMFWDWNQGYIFFKLEGNFTSVNTASLKGYALHVGGFTFPTNYVRKFSFNLPSTLNIVKGHSPCIYFNTTVDEVFKTPTVIDLDSYYATTGGKFCGPIADNYMDMFSIDHIEN